jgi:hypothetical protein
LRSLRQEWREDATNRDVKHTRNKVRHELLPLLKREYNPNIYQQLADAAEVARAEEEYWTGVIRRQEEKQHSAVSLQHSAKQVPRFARDDNQSQTQGPSPRARDGRSLGMTSEIAKHSIGMTNAGDPNGSETRDAACLRIDQLLNEPLAVRRRVVREVFQQVSGRALDFQHTDALVRFLERRESSLLQLPEHWFAVLNWLERTMSFEERAPVRKGGTGGTKQTSKSEEPGGGK